MIKKPSAKKAMATRRSASVRGWRAGAKRIAQYRWTVGAALGAGLALIVISIAQSPTTPAPISQPRDLAMESTTESTTASATVTDRAITGNALIDDTAPLDTTTPSIDSADALMLDDAGAPALATTDPAPTPPGVSRDWQRVEVKSGQSMGRIFKSLDLSAKLLHDLVRLDDQTAQLVTIKPGDVFFFSLDQDGQFQALKGEHDESNWLVVEQMPSGELVSQLEPRAIERRVVEARAVIDSSLFNAAVDAGLSNNMTMQLANVFGWDIDFALDIRKGDRFSLIYEEIWRDGEFLRDGAILAARFVNRGDSFEAVRFDAGNGPDYFDLNGRPMRKAFLRAPLNFTRVTSNFNPKRFHPVTRRIRPHNGTDYGAAPGTPVWAAGDGTVIESAYNRANGNYVFVQHGNHIVTRYLHLTRRDVNKGDRVKQGETIGTVGSTGLATGPHLHYEFLVNGAHRDPRKVDLPPVEPLPQIERERFLTHSQPLIERLNRVDEQATLLASMNPQTCPDSDESC